MVDRRTENEIRYVNNIPGDVYYDDDPDSDLVPVKVECRMRMGVDPSNGLSFVVELVIEGDVIGIPYYAGYGETPNKAWYSIVSQLSRRFSDDIFIRKIMYNEVLDLRDKFIGQFPKATWRT